MKNLFYLHNISPIGGVETFLYEIALKYGKKYDITIMYKNGDPDQVARLQKLVRTKKWDGVRKYTAEKVFFGYNSDIAFAVEAKDYYFVMHCDYKVQNLPLPKLPEGCHVLAVSEGVRKNGMEKFGIDIDLCYNPLVVPKPKKMLRLITASRLSPEKGGRRMEVLCRALEHANIPFTWEVFTNDAPTWNSDNMIYRTPRLDITDYIAAADYLVQLSDTEGYSYSIIEALSVGTPVIVTDIPPVHDMQVKDGENGFVLPLDLTEDKCPVDAIYEGLPPFKYVPRKDGYEKLLAPGKSDYEEQMKKPTRVVTKIYYFDIELDKKMSPGDEQTVLRSRAEYLEDRGFVEILDDTSI